MRGSIRVFTGLIITMFAAGGMDNAADNQLYVVLLVACAGLALMYSGVSAMKENR